MINIAGSISTEEEQAIISLAGKLILVGQRARELAQQGRRKDKDESKTH